MKVLCLILVIFNLSYSFEFLGNIDGVSYYCIEDYVYVHGSVVLDNSEYEFVPVVYEVNGNWKKLPCNEYNKWIKE